MRNENACTAYTRSAQNDLERVHSNKFKYSWAILLNTEHRIRLLLAEEWALLLGNSRYLHLKIESDIFGIRHDTHFNEIKRLSMCVKVCVFLCQKMCYSLFMELIAIIEPNSHTVQGLKKAQQPKLQYTEKQIQFPMRNDDTFYDYILSFIFTMLGNCVRFL